MAEMILQRFCGLIRLDVSLFKTIVIVLGKSLQKDHTLKPSGKQYSDCHHEH